MKSSAKNHEKIADRVMDASAVVLPRLTCPDCGGPLNIQYTDSSNLARRKRRVLSVMCETCVWRVILDGLPHEPAWVSELGRKITTGEPAAR